MDKLLTEQELREEAEQFLATAYNQRDHGDLSDSLVNELSTFIQSQKKAHADMVIGEDEKPIYTEQPPSAEVSNPWLYEQNHLRAEQRERNK